VSAAQCALCNVALPTGALRYVTEVTVTADHDPFLAVPDDIDGEIERTLKAMEEAARKGRADELEAQVVTRRAFLLCPGCREAFLGGLPGRLQ